VGSFQPRIEKFANAGEHMTQRSNVLPIESEFELTVPAQNFFVLGDNRDQSQDSRFWGFVPRENLKGKAEFIWLSLNYEGIKCKTDLGPLKIRWDRFGRKIQ
jgi:signal peptidase I